MGTSRMYMFFLSERNVCCDQSVSPCSRVRFVYPHHFGAQVAEMLKGATTDLHLLQVPGNTCLSYLYFSSASVSFFFFFISSLSLSLLSFSLLINV